MIEYLGDNNFISRIAFELQSDTSASYPNSETG